MMPMAGCGLGSFFDGAGVYLRSISSPGWQEKLRRERLQTVHWRCRILCLPTLARRARVFANELLERHGPIVLHD
jgi:hypothetical protein